MSRGIIGARSFYIGARPFFSVFARYQTTRPENLPPLLAGTAIRPGSPREISDNAGSETTQTEKFYIKHRVNRLSAP